MSLVLGNIVALVHRVGSQLITDAAMVQHHTLRTTCGSTGINQVSEIIRRDVCSDHIAAGMIKQRLNIQHLIGRNQTGMRCIGDDITGIGVVENQLNAIGGIVRVARNKGCAGLQDTIHRKHHPAGTRQQHGHPVAWLHATFNKGIGYAVGSGVEFCVCECCIAGYQCETVRMLNCMLLHTMMQ